MKSLHYTADFHALYQRLIARIDPEIPTIVIPASTCAQASGANDIIRVAKKEILKQDQSEKINLRITGCHGFCQMEPNVLVEPRGTFYPRVGMKEMAFIVEAVSKGEVLEDLLYTDPASGERIEKAGDIPFFRKQVRTILSQNEKVDPIRIYNYIEDGGYMALVDVLGKRNPAEVIDEVKTSGLRGRGGAGFPTGIKWEMLAGSNGGRGKVLVCNADEGDPGAYMDRAVLEGNPHSIIEGMIIGAYATGATEGVVYVRAEYPLAVKHLIIALRQAHELGLLGHNILGSGFSFDIDLIKGAGAFVCGEETALMRSIEGKMGEPRQRPPYPVEKGVGGLPTSINNVETWANVPVIFREGAKEFLRVGTKNNSGTKIFSLVGKIKNTGLVEVPMGMTIDEIVNEIGGGREDGVPIKAVQTGGPSGGCIPAERFDLRIDYDSLAQAGSIMGSGGMIVMDENTCMVDVAKYFMKFLKSESCGKCFTCRKGTQRMYEILDDITRGKGTLEHLELLEELALAVKDTTMCGLGQTAPNPVLSTLRYFRDEYIEHVQEKRCPAGVCKELVGAPCQDACPLGTEAWRYIAHLQRGEYEDAYRVIREPNPFPSVCARVCSHPCEGRCRAGTSGGEPVAIRSLKRFITDRVDPAVYKPERCEQPVGDAVRVAVVGAGPAGLAAAHCLSLKGYQVVVFEAEARPGGMLVAGIPAYRLPRDILQKEIDAIVDEQITLKCNTVLGRDVTVDGLFEQGFKAVYLAMGAHKSRRMNIGNEEAKGVLSGMEFLKAFNLRGAELGKGRVGVVGGGNSAVDAARVALRQSGVESVTIFYRRTRQEMPAYGEEIEAALEEGVKIETLVMPTKIHAEDDRLASIECIRNELGEVDAGGRRRPVSIPGTEATFPLDTLIVAIGEEPDTDSVSSMGITVDKGQAVAADVKTCCTSRPGVFAGGDIVTGPNTVVEAIAAGKKAAATMDRYIRGEELIRPSVARLPRVLVEPVDSDAAEVGAAARALQPRIPVEERKRNFVEVEEALSEEDATREAGRCLRCDLEFTQAAAESVRRESGTGDAA